MATYARLEGFNIILEEEVEEKTQPLTSHPKEEDG